MQLTFPMEKTASILQADMAQQVTWEQSFCFWEEQCDVSPCMAGCVIDMHCQVTKLPRVAIAKGDINARYAVLIGLWPNNFAVVALLERCVAAGVVIMVMGIQDGVQVQAPVSSCQLPKQAMLRRKYTEEPGCCCWATQQGESIWLLLIVACAGHREGVLAVQALRYLSSRARCTGLDSLGSTTATWPVFGSVRSQT